MEREKLEIPTPISTLLLGWIWVLETLVLELWTFLSCDEIWAANYLHT